MKRKALALTLVLALLFSAVAGTQLSLLATANPVTSTLPIIAMPEEYINYTVTRVNGTWWAKIDGTYPLYILNESDNASYCVPPELPMVYPTPPDTTNIHIKIDETELNWNNYTETYPNTLHHTVIGDWTMIYCLITPVPEQFVLKIHYEHPLQLTNGSYLLLYDLNVSPYLSPQSPNSTAYFTFNIDTNVSNLQAYTTETDSVWNPINYTTRKEGATEIISIQMYSEYSKPLAGDIVITFSDSAAQVTDELPYWIILPLLIIAAILAATIYRRKRRQNSRHTTET